MINVETVSNILFELDLLSTGCVENNLTDEYASEAKEIVSMLNAKFPLMYTINTVFNYFFWDGCLSQKNVDTLCEKISSNY